MALRKTAHDGYLHVDHRASPGLPEGVARRLDFDPLLCAAGKVFEASTLGCPHCGSVVVLNPQRTRERANCFKCNRYICDACRAVMDEPEYVHRTFQQVAEMVRSGKYVLLAGSTACRPKLVPKLLVRGT